MQEIVALRDEISGILVHFEHSPRKRDCCISWWDLQIFWCIFCCYIYLFWDCKPMVAGMESRGLNADSRTPHEMSIESSRQRVLAHGVAANRQCGIIVDIMQWCAFVPDHVPAKNTKQNQSFSSFSTRHTRTSNSDLDEILKLKAATEYWNSYAYNSI